MGSERTIFSEGAGAVMKLSDGAGWSRNKLVVSICGGWDGGVEIIFRTLQMHLSCFVSYFLYRVSVFIPSKTEKRKEARNLHAPKP